MISRRGTLAAVAAIGLGLGLGSCGRTRSGGHLPQKLMVLLGTDVTSLDPHVPFDNVSSVVIGNVFEPLVRFDRQLRLVGDLAERWINPDEKTWRFFLDRRARFQDGSPVKASDVKFSIERLLSLQGSPVTAFVHHVTGIDLVDERTLDVHTDRPVAILNDLAFVQILSESHARRAGDKLADQPLGSGAYRVEHWEKGRVLRLAASEFAREKPEIERVEMAIRDGPGLVEEIQKLQPDLTLFLRQSGIEAYEKGQIPGLRLIAADGIYVTYVGFNVRERVPGVAGRNPLADPRLRRALVRATDGAAIVEKVLHGRGRTTTQLVVPEVFGFDPTLPSTPVDPATARSMIQAAGLEGVRITIHGLKGGSRLLEDELRAQWERAGVRLDRVELPEPQLAQEVTAGRFQSYVEAWGCTSADAAELLSYLLRTPDLPRGLGTGNYYGFSNLEIDRIVGDNLGVFDPRRRLAMLQKALRIASEEAVFIPLHSGQDLYLAGPRLDWTPRVDGELRLEEVRLRQ